MPYAANTEVSVDKSRAEIEALARKYSADQFVSGWKEDQHQATVQFRCQQRYVKFVLPLPVQKDYSNRRKFEQAERRIWRALALIIKAKLEAVSSGIVSFEEEFMAHIVMPDGKTMAEHFVPQIEAAYTDKRIPQLQIGGF